MDGFMCPMLLANPGHHQAKGCLPGRIVRPERIKSVIHKVLRDRPKNRLTHIVAQHEGPHDPAIIASPIEARGV
eukprot:12638866-Heterocapsa_arctica.AAC.1